MSALNTATIIGIVVATLGGAAIGLERQRSGHASGPHARFGGIRTFTMLGGLAGLAGWWTTIGLVPLAVVVLAAAAALVVVSYVSASRTNIDGTTEVAAIVVLTAGAIAGTGGITLASAIIAATAVLLIEKSRLHTMASRVDDMALRASARFAAMACIVLPLLPSGPFGPLGAIRPREMWALVLFFSGLNFVGWMIRRSIGPHHGVIVSGLLGGIVSSTSVTWTFARESRAETAPRLALGAGVVAACTVMLVRVLIASAVLNPALSSQLPRYIGLAFLLGAAVVLIAWRVSGAKPVQNGASDSPLQLKSALQMTALFQIVLFVIVAVQARLGSHALIATSVFVGLTDLDALTLSLARSTSPADVPLASLALVSGILSNTLLKMMVTVVVGRGSFRTLTAAVLIAMVVSTAIMVVLR